MSEVKFSKEHEWIKLEGEIAIIGIPNNLATGSESSEGDIIFGELVKYKSA